MSATPSSLMAHINDLNERDDYEGIIKFIEALSPEEQTADVIGQLARAYNNLAKAGEVEPLEKALRLLDSIAPSDRENHYWHFRRAYSLFFLDRITESLDHWQKALEYKPDDEDTKEFIQLSKKQLNALTFYHPFRERIVDAWRQFSESESHLRELCNDGPLTTQLALEEIEKIFHPVASDKWYVELSQEVDKIHLTISPKGWRLTAFPLREFLRHVPASLTNHWRFEFGFQPVDSPHILEAHVGKRVLRASELTVVPKKEEGGTYRLVFTGPELAAIDEDELPGIFAALEWMVQKTLGESVQSQWFSDLGIYRDEPTEEGLALPDLVRYVRECIPGASGFTLDDFLNQDTEILQEPDRDPDCDLLFDATKLVMRCPALHNGYNQNDAQCMIELERQGISAGIVFFTVAPEVSEADKTQLRETLATLLKDPERQDAFLCTGFGSALRYEYVEGLFWDSKTIFDLLLEWFKSQPKIKQAAFHSFLRICGSGIFKSPDQDETETCDGSDTSEEVVR